MPRLDRLYLDALLRSQGAGRNTRGPATIADCEYVNLIQIDQVSKKPQETWEAANMRRPLTAYLHAIPLIPLSHKRGSTLPRLGRLDDNGHHDATDGNSNSYGKNGNPHG